MRPFRLAFLSLFVTQNALAQAGEPPKPADPPSAPTPADDEEPVDDDVATEGEKSPDAPTQPKPEEPAKPPPKKAPEKEERAPTEATESEEEISDAELEAELEGSDMKKAPPKGQGAVVGVITDTKFNEPLIEAQVEVVGLKKRTLTDLEGRFRFDLPPGTYTIRAGYELHKSSRAEGVRVVAGKFERVNLELVPDEGAVDEIFVEAELEKTSTEGQTLERKRSAAVGDGVGRAEIARTPDRNAAEAAQRVVGATIVGNRFVYVRGLGERYTNALLNGTPLPSPEPDRQTVPLDLFPSLVLDSVNIVKQFTPDYPGDFAGGSVRINTREFPRETLFQVTLGLGYDTTATFRNRLDYYGSNTDWLGFDGGQRELPEDLPETKLNRNAPDADRVHWGKEINSYLSTLRSGTPPNHGISVVAGDSWKLGAEQKLGAVATLNYGRTYRIVDIKGANFRGTTVEGTPVVRAADTFEGEQGIDSVRWGSLVSVSFEPSKGHKFNLTGLHSQSADDLTSSIDSVSESNGFLPIHSHHLEYVSRALNFLQLRGEHGDVKPDDPRIDWHASYAVASREQPDTRDVSYFKGDNPTRGTGYTWFQGPQSGFHFYSDQSETTLSAGADASQPIIRGDETVTKLKLGWLLSSRDRDFGARRFTFVHPRGGTDLGGLDFCAGATWNRACPDRLFRTDVVDGSRLDLDETTLLFDEYEAGLDVYATYGMIDSQIIKTVRVIAGVRMELTDQHFVAYDPFDHDSNVTQRSTIKSTDWLPALSVVYSTTQKSNTRFGLSQTIARPQLREITPFLSTSYTAELPVQGNPKLKLTKIQNADLRYEYFPTLKEVAAFSFFYKHFDDPIEAVVVPGGNAGITTFANADSADLIGLELEARKSLEFLAPVMKDFAVITNVTLSHSQVDLGDKAGASTNPSRPMSFQSPYVFNFSVDYNNATTRTDVRVLYNVSGPRITSVGIQGLPDTYELPRHLVDATVAQKIAKNFELKLTAQNLLSEPIEFAHRNTQEYVVVRQSDGTQTLEPGKEDPVTRSYDVGTVISLFASYTY